MKLCGGGVGFVVRDLDAMVVESAKVQWRWRGRRCNEEGKEKNEGGERERQKENYLQFSKLKK